MFYSQQFLSKKGPLGSIWVAAYCLKRLHRDQIAQTDIPSSVDKILTDEWPTVTYRILGYLLLGVVRIYSKKVEFVLHDCHDTINELNKSLGKKKAVSFREIVRTAQDFTLTLPERYELDAFVLEVASDVNKAHIAENADITIPECLRNGKTFKRSINKRRGNITVQGTTTLTVSKASAATLALEACPSSQNSPESLGMETWSITLPKEKEFNMEASSSKRRRTLEESIEEFREIRFSREECLDFDMFYQNDTDHIGIFESSNIIQSLDVEQSNLSIIMQTEKDGHVCYEAEDETSAVFEKSHDFEMPSDIHDHVDTEVNEANFTVQASPDLNIIQSVDVEQSNLSSVMQMEKDGHVCYEAEDETAAVFEKSHDFEMPLDIHDHVDPEVNEANFTVQASPDLNLPSSNDKYVDIEDEVNFTDKSLAEIASDNYESVTVVRNVTITPSNDKYVDVEDGVNLTDKSPDPEIASDNYETTTAARKVTFMDSENVSEPDTCTPVSSGKDKLPLNVQTTPNLKIPDVKEPSSTELLAVRTPANKEHRAKKANKRKCICDDFTVISNQTLKRYINDPSDLVRKRRRVPHTSLDVWRLSCTDELPQKFMEPLISWNKDIQRNDIKVDQVVTREASDIPVMAVVSQPIIMTDGLTIAPVSPPRIVTDGLTIAPVSPPRIVTNGPIIAPGTPPRIVTDGLIIAPGTPTRCSTSTRAFPSPKAADSDGEGPFRPFQIMRRESPCQSFENARTDLVADIVEGIMLDLMDKDMEQNGESKELDGWSTRTRTVAKWLHQVFASKAKRSDEDHTAKLSQLLGGKTKKESAEVFYEILVLRSGGYVNVSQERSYDDILLQETSKMEAKLA